MYEDNDLCPTSIDAKIGESITICCPVQGFPPPEVNWELPNGTLLKTENTILHLTVKTKDDFGRYRCNARGLEDTVLDSVVTVHKKSKYTLNTVCVRINQSIQVKCGFPSNFLLKPTLLIG